MTIRLDAQALVIPPGVQMFADENGFRIGNQGDIVIHGQPTLKLQQLTSSQGSVHLSCDTATRLTRIDAPLGEVVLSGELAVSIIVARKIVLHQGKLTAKALVAEELVNIQGDGLQVDILLAPSVEIGQKTKGRATVIESKNDLGPHMLKGGFRLEEYLELFPTGKDLLDQIPEIRARLARWDAPVNTAGADSVAEIHVTDDDEDADLPVPFDGQTSASERTADGEAEVLTLTETVKTSRADPNAEPRLSADQAEELYQRLSESFLKIMSAYPDGRLPPPLSTVETLVEERRFGALKRQIASLWNDLLQYHKREGLHIANAVTNNIREMRQLLQELP